LIPNSTYAVPSEFPLAPYGSTLTELKEILKEQYRSNLVSNCKNQISKGSIKFNPLFFDGKNHFTLLKQNNHHRKKTEEQAL
jgi:hypothetical protein